MNEMRKRNEIYPMVTTTRRFFDGHFSQISLTMSQIFSLNLTVVYNRKLAACELLHTYLVPIANASLYYSYNSSRIILVLVNEIGAFLYPLYSLENDVGLYKSDEP